LEKVGDENHDPDLSFEGESEPVDDEAHNGPAVTAAGAQSGLWIGDKVKIRGGHGIAPCSHSSPQLKSHMKTGKIKIDAKSIGENNSALKSGMDVYKAPVGTDKDNMGKALEIRKIAVEADSTSPMGVRVVEDNIVINGGGLDRDITVRSTALRSDIGGEQQVKMTFLDGILKGLDPVAGGDGYGKHLNLVVTHKSYTRVTTYTGDTNMMKFDSTGSSTTYYWRHGLYVGTADPGLDEGEVAITENVDYWADNTPP
jgi:hypothetical protein